MKGFIPKFYRDGSADAWVYPAGAAATYHIGEALKLTSGKVGACTGNDTPDFICMAEIVIATAGDPVPCIPVSESTEYEVELAAAVSGLAAGSVVAISSDAMSLAAVSSGTGGVKVVSTTGAAKGDKAVVKFK